MSLSTFPSAPVAVNRPADAGPVIVSIPHAGRIYPQEILDAARVPQSVLERLEDGWSDLIAGEAVQNGATVVTALYARAVADINRSENQMATNEVAPDLKPVMFGTGVKERAGLGVVPTHLSGVGALWQHPINAASLERRLEMIHRPYHAILADEIEALRRHHGFAIIIDLHSMPTIGKNQLGHGQGLIIGDLFGKSGADLLTQAALQTGHDMNLSVGLNRPYAGGYILARHGNPSRQVYAVQMEWDRALYLTPDRMPDVMGVKRLSAAFGALVRQLSDGHRAQHTSAIAAE